MSTFSSAHKNNICTYESRAASHKFCFSHLELCVHIYSLNMHVNTKQQSSKIRDFFPSEKVSKMKYSHWNHFSAVGNSIFSIWEAVTCIFYLFCMFSVQNTCMISIHLSIWFQHKPAFYKLISCTIFVWRLHLKYAKWRGQSSFSLLNKLVSEVLQNSNTDNMRNTRKERVRKTQWKVFCMSKITGLLTRNSTLPKNYMWRS